MMSEALLQKPVNRVTLFQDFLRLVESKNINDSILYQLVTNVVAIPQIKILNKVKEKLAELAINDPEFPGGICDAVSKMDAVISQSQNQGLINTYLKGMIMIAYSNPANNRDFSDVMMAFYKCFKFAQVDYAKYEINEELLMQLLQDPNDPLIQKKLELPFLFKVSELKRLFSILIERRYLQSKGTSFFVKTDKHATSGLYKTQIFRYLDSNFMFGPQYPNDMDALIQAIQNALLIGSYKAFDADTDFLPLNISTIIGNFSKESKHHLRTILKHMFPDHNEWVTVKRKCTLTGINALWLAAQTGNVPAIELYLEMHIDPNCARLKDGLTPFMVAVLNRHYAAAVALTKFSKQKTKSQYTIDIDLTLKSKNDKTALSYATETKEIKYVQLVLDNGGAAVINEFNHATPHVNPLYYACATNCDDIVTLLLQRGADPNLSVPNQPSLLFKLLARDTKLKILTDLVKYNANVGFVDPVSGNSIFLEAVKQKKHDFVAQLIKHPIIRANPHLLLNSKTGKDPVEIAVDNDDLEMLQLLLQAGFARDDYKLYKTAFYNSIRKQNFEIFSTLLVVFPQLLKTTEDGTGNTPLHVAVAFRDKQFVELICEANYHDINSHNNNDESALYIAAKKDQVENAKILLIHPFYDVPTAQIENGLVSVDPVTHQKEPLESPFVAAVLEGHVGMVKYLISLGANTFTTYNGGQPVIQCAVINNFVEITECIIKDGVNPNQLCRKEKANEDNSDDESDTENRRSVQSLLSIAAQNNFLAMAQKLIELGANVNAPDEYQVSQTSPLYYAVMNNHIEMCALLLKHGADATQKFIVDDVDDDDNEDDEKTAIQIATEKDQPEILWLIHFYQQRTPQQQIKAILTTTFQIQAQMQGQLVDDQSRRHVTPRLYPSAVALLQKELANIVALNQPQAQMEQAIVAALLAAATQSTIPNAIQEQITWYLEYVAKDVPRPSNNLGLRPEDITTDDMIALAHQFAGNQL